MDEYPIAAPATALVPSALAVVRCSGQGSIEMISSLFTPGARLLTAPGNSMHHGTLHAQGGEPLDEVVVGIFRAPSSYTGEDSAEIYGHGSPAGIRRILEALYAIGFHPAAPGEFTRRAFLNGKLDLTRAEAINDVVHSQTLEAHRLALDRLGGSVAAAVEPIRGDLIRLMAQISIQLDYPEEDIADASVDDGLLASCAQRLRSLAETYRHGRLVQEGVAVALAGRPNSGKSSLFNMLLRQDRSIVSDLPGTTRDYLEALVDINGIPVRLYDTAGLRPAESRPAHTPPHGKRPDAPSTDAIEAEGIRRSRSIIAAADLVLYLLDAVEGQTHDDNERIAEISAQARMIVVWNKIDSNDARSPGLELTGGPFTGSAVPVSATTGAGIEDLNARIAEVVSERGDGLRPEAASAAAAVEGSSRGTVVTGGGGSAIIDSARQHHLLVRAASSVEQTRESLAAGMPVDVLAVDLQDAIAAVGEITGEVVTDEILDAMFGDFCVGK